EQRRRAAAVLRLRDDPPGEPFGVEVEAEDRGERDEAGECKRRLVEPPAERREQGGVHEEVDLGVEVAAERARPSREARELAVRVVEERLQLDEKRGGEQGAAPELDGARESRGARGEDDSRRRHAQPRQDSTSGCAS